MSLASKVKDVFSSGESKHASRGEVDPNTPGSFPADSTPGATAVEGHEHNKLHKSNDPRGWTEGDKPFRSHGHTDSGVGLADRTNPESAEYNQGLTSEKPVGGSFDRSIDRPAEPTTQSFGERTSDRLNDPASQRLDEPAGEGLGKSTEERLTEPTGERLGERPAEDRLGDNTNLASKDKDAFNDTPVPLASTNEHPYWGDLPTGAGTYNTVTGHGSPDDDLQRHRDFHSGEHHANPGATTGASYLGTRPSQGTGAEQPTLETAKLPESQRAAEGHQDTTQVTGIPQDQETTETSPREKTSNNSRFKEGLEGAAVAGAAGYGAHELGKRHDDEQAQKANEDLSTSQVPEEKKQRSFPLIGHKDHKDKEAKKEAKREAKEEAKEAKKEKHAEPKPEKESRFGALFHRSRKEESDPQAEEELAEEKRDKHHSKATPAAAAAGVGGAAAYAATRDRHHDNKTQDDPAANRHQDSTVPQQTAGTGYESNPAYNTQATQPTSQYTEPTSQSYQQPQHGSHHRDAGLATGAAAGLGAGALASHELGKRHDDTQNIPADTSRGLQSSQQPFQQQGAYSQQPSAQSYQQQDTLARDPASQAYSQENPHHHRDTNLAAGTAAGLGAGALASHELGKRHEHTQPTAGDASRAAQPGQTYQQTQSGAYSQDPAAQSYQQQDTRHRDAGLATGAAGLGAGALAAHELGKRHDNFQPSTGDLSRSTQPGQTYQQPQSGAFPQEPAAQSYQQQGAYSQDPAAQSYEQQDTRHGNAGLATGAAGVGAGALAAHELGKKHDNSQYSPQDTSRGFQPNQSGSVTGAENTSSPTRGSTRDRSSKEYEDRISSSVETPSVTERANQGQYAHLASGTPSGVGSIDNTTGDRLNQRETTSIPSTQKDSHYGAAGAAGLGAVAGVGTAAALSRNRDEKTEDPLEKEKARNLETEPKSESKIERQAEKLAPAGLASGTGSSKPVIHHCQKCGEANDISKYFTSNKSDRI